MKRIYRLLPTYWAYVLTFILLELIVCCVLWYFYTNYATRHESEIIDRIDVAFRATVNGYSKIAEILYEEIVNTPEIIKIFAPAHNASKEEQDIIRKKLYAALSPTYQRLTHINLRQLHFQLPDNTSFLRFHSPSKFGDDLTNIRYSIATVNKTKRRVQGFEEGRIFNGFRYVFPLFEQETHIGSVEVSVSFEAIKNEIKKIYGLDYNFMLKREVVTNTVFKSNLDNYTTCILDDTYFCESDKIYQRQIVGSTLLNISNKLRNRLTEQLSTGQAFSKYLWLNKNYYTTVFYPLHNTQGQHVAYIMTYNQDDNLYRLRYQFIILLLSISLTNVLLFVFVYYRQQSSKLIATQNDRLTRLNQEKNEFLSIAAHDLKNPLHTVQGSSELIQLSINDSPACNDADAYELKQEVLGFTGMINESVERMFSLITNLLDVNMIEAGKFKIELRHIDILPIVHTIISEYNGKAKAKNIIINLSASENQYFAYVDGTAFRQVLDNLVSNAVKYSPFGQEIHVILLCQDCTVSIKIQDNGVGLSEADQQKLFGKFTRLSPKPTGDEHSNGLGLFIVKKLVDAMQGKVWCESRPGHGATFITSFNCCDKA